MLNKTIYSVLFMLFTWSGLKAQRAFEVVILSDAAEQENHFFESAIKTEITALLGSQYELGFTAIYTNGDLSKIKQAIADVFAQNQADVLIATGITSSQLLANQSAFPVPSMASIQINNNTITDAKSSGIPNFTYLNSPFNIKYGIAKLQEICRCKKIAILTDPSLLAIGRSREKQYAEVETKIEWLALETDLSSTVAQISADVEGVYILSSLANYTTDEIALFFEEINERKLPSFTLLDDPLLALGAYASFAASDNLKKIPRRIALNVEQIAEGRNPKDFSVEIQTFTQQLVVNMETVNKVGKYPNWNTLDNAILTNINRPNTERTLNLKAAIAEGIQNNLGYQIEAKQTEISANGVGLAKF